MAESDSKYPVCREVTSRNGRIMPILRAIRNHRLTFGRQMDLANIHQGDVVNFGCFDFQTVLTGLFRRQRARMLPAKVLIMARDLNLELKRIDHDVFVKQGNPRRAASRLTGSLEQSNIERAWLRNHDRLPKRRG